MPTVDDDDNDDNDKTTITIDADDDDNDNQLDNNQLDNDSKLDNDNTLDNDQRRDRSCKPINEMLRTSPGLLAPSSSSVTPVLQSVASLQVNVSEPATDGAKPGTCHKSSGRAEGLGSPSRFPRLASWERNRGGAREDEDKHREAEPDGASQPSTIIIGPKSPGERRLREGGTETNQYTLN